MHRNLLALAKDLATLDKRRPRQVSLRRAVSTAYYALYHQLLDTAVRRMFPDSCDRALRDAAARSFTHGAMKRLAIQALKPPQKRERRYNDVLGAQCVSEDLQDVCQTLLTLQAAREKADYDLSPGARQVRSDVSALLRNVERVSAVWRTISATAEGRRFVLALVLYGRERPA